MRYLSMPSRVSGSIRAPPSKSHTHRAIVMAALSGGPCEIRRPLLADDTEATIAGMSAFGAEILQNETGLRVSAGPLHAADALIDARNSGTTLRLLAGVAALVPGPTILTGDPSLRKRPMAPLLDALQNLGADALSLGGDGRPPVRVRGVLRGGRASLPGFISSQFLSSLLIACPLAADPSEVTTTLPIRSEPYVEMTRRMSRSFGIEIDVEGTTFRIPGRQSYTPREVDIPGDFSSAAFPLVAAAITDGDVTVEGLDSDSSDGGRRIVDVLRSFGAKVDTAPNRVRVRSGDLIGQTIDVGDSPDLFPVLAVLATQADGETRFVHGEHLPLKECDRIAATVSMLRALGGHAEPTADGCIVRGPDRLRGAFVDARGDHRMLMAAAVAGLAARGPLDISDPWCFRVSYPSFLDDMRALGALQAVVG